MSAAGDRRARAARVRRLFDEALELPPGARDTFLDGACGEDLELRRHVEALLGVDTEAHALFDRDTRRPTGTLAAARPEPASIGPYLVKGVLGRGGMGVVYDAEDERSGARVALKSVAIPGVEMAASLRREVRALSRLRHPGVVRILEDGLVGGVPWYAMERVDGASLRALLERGTPLPELLTIVRRLCAVLAYVHGEGVVHRDLKPDNVCVRPDGTPVLLDFGLTAPFAGPVSRESLEAIPDAMGTAAYLAPEQALGETVDARTDLYALGCILHEILTGKPPERGASPLPVGGAPLPPQLEALVRRLLAPDPRKRVGHAADVATVLVALGADPADPWQERPVVRSYLYRAGVHGRGAPIDEIGALARELGGRCGAVVLVSGESGVGKTRLLLEAGSDAAARGLAVVSGECPPPSERLAGTPLAPFRRLLVEIADRHRATLSSQGNVPIPWAEVLARYEPSLQVPGSPDGGDAESLEPAQERARVVRALLDAIAAHTAASPLVLLLDDLQWADELSLEALSRLARTASSRALLLVGAYRDEERSPELGRIEELEGVRSLPLARLSPLEVSSVVADMLARDDAPAPFVSFLAQASEGNPFYVAEYLRSAVDEGWLGRDEAGVWRLSAGVTHASLPLPRSLRELVSRRLAALPEPAQELARLLAVLGRESGAGLLARASPQGEEERGLALACLVARHVVQEPRPGVVRFAHDMLREVAHGAIGDEERPGLHRRAADALEQLPEADRQREMAALGGHWRLAGEPQRAWPCLLAAARDMTAAFSLREAERLYKAGLALAPEGEERTIARHELAWRVLVCTGARHEAARELVVALAEARALGRRDLECVVLRSAGRVSQYLGASAEAIATCREALAIALQLDDAALAAEAKLALAAVWNEQGRGLEGRAWAEEALAACRAQGNEIGTARALTILAVDRHTHGDVAAARALYLETLELCRARFPHFAAVVLSNLGNLARETADLPAAERYFHESLAVSRAIGKVDIEAVALGSLAALEGTRGRLDEERRLHEQAVALLRDVDEPASLAIALQNLASVLVEQERLDEAEAAIEEGLAIARATEAARTRAYLLALQGLIAAARGELDHAARHGDEAQAAMDATGSPTDVARMHLMRAGWERRRGQAAAAAAHLRDAIAGFEAAGERIDLAHTLLELARTERDGGGDGAAHVARAAAIARALELPAGSRLCRELAELETPPPAPL